MQAESSTGRRAARTVAVTEAKRAMRSAAIWGTLFGVLIANEVLGYHKSFPTLASRDKFAHTLGSNTGISAIIGPARHVNTIGGFVAWRVFGLLIIVGAIWGMLTATRLLRREEEAGRWELVLAGRTTRRHATAQALTGMAAGWLTLWALTAALTVIAGSRPNIGFSVSSSLFYATAATASAAMFLAVGALASQFAQTRRAANGLAAAVFALCYLIRMVADSGIGLEWMRWVSPLGWVENLRPLTGSQPLALAPIAVLTAAAAIAAISIAGRRDLGVGMLTRSRSMEPSTRLLGSPVLLVIWLERWVALAWIGGLGALAMIFGVVARSAAAGNVAVEAIKQQLSRLGAHPGGAVEAWIGYEFLYLAALLAFAVAGQVSAARSEEADGHLDNLLARHLSRAEWLAGRVGFGVAMAIAAGVATSVGGWIGVTAGNSQVGMSAMLQAGLNITVPALFIIGVGTLLYGLVPRFAPPLLYSLILWSFLVEIIGSSITSNHWLLDTAVLSHLGPVPATSLNWTVIAWLCGLAAAATVAGIAAFNKRDLVTA
ncbi:MAG: ABC transporter permease subunit [Streptosporangiaceae bacterium]